MVSGWKDKIFDQVPVRIYTPTLEAEFYIEKRAPFFRHSCLYAIANATLAGGRK